MNPLEPVQPARLVLSFDFDGTLHDPAADPPVDPALFRILRQLREERGAIWGINTGRSMAHTIEGLIESRFPFSPDWVVAREREIWFPNRFGRWIGHEPWNKRLEKEHKRFFRKVRKTLSTIRHEVEEHTGATWIVQEGEPAGLVARTEEEMAWIAGRVTELAVDQPELGWQRNSIWLRFGHKKYQKGSSLAEVARHFDVPADGCFAIGDSHNDFAMLDPAVAGMIACPSNAVPEIRAHVAAHGGHQTATAHSQACVEALEHFFT